MDRWLDNPYQAATTNGIVGIVLNYPAALFVEPASQSSNRSVAGFGRSGNIKEAARHRCERVNNCAGGLSLDASRRTTSDDVLCAVSASVAFYRGSRGGGARPIRILTGPLQVGPTFHTLKCIYLSIYLSNVSDYWHARCYAVFY